MQPSLLAVGLIEDDPVMGGSIVQRLEIEGCSVRWWKSGGDAIAIPEAALRNLDILVCDMRLPDMNGEEIYRQMIAGDATPPFLFITGYGEIDQAVRLMRMGAADYLTKPFEFTEFLSRIRAGARAPGARIAGAGILGISPEIAKLERTLANFARTDLPVLITGETGVGKEVSARYLHGLSPHPKEPFMAVNCAAIPGELLESELFGHEKGAFTGAAKRHLGYAERAGRGTLFLDEIGEMPLMLQSKLLRLIEERAFHRVGGEDKILFRARVIAATQNELTGQNATGKFREDLYFRLSVLPVHIAPLRDRRDDICWLMDKFMTDACERHDRHVRGYSAVAAEAAVAYPWPGNARELRNRIERAVALTVETWITPADLFPERMARQPAATAFAPLAEVRDAAERAQIERALEATSGHIQDAARLLGISRTTLWEKMSRLGVKGARSEN